MAQPKRKNSRFLRYLYGTRALITLLLALVSLGAAAQTAADEAWKQNRWVFGGNAALAFGNTFTVIGAAPTAGYRVTERFTLGAGGLYFFQRWRTFNNQVRTTQIYGPQAYGRFSVAESLISDGDRLFIQSDYYLVSTEAYSPIELQFSRVWVPQWFVGAGYFTRLGGNTFGGLMVMWDLIGDTRAPFPNPMIRAGVSLGL